MKRVPQSVAARLAEEIEANRLQSDAGQLVAAVHLDDLRAKLVAAPPLAFMRMRLRTHKPHGLYLWGGVGRGKTLLMDYFFATLQQAKVQAERAHFYRFMRAVHAELGGIKHRHRPLDIVAQRMAARVRVLCLDELFVADIADAMILAALFEGLFSRGVTLVTTSNVPPLELYKDGLQRQRFMPAIESICAHVDVIHLHGPVDYRLRELERAPTYLDSARVDTNDALLQRFTALAAGIGTEPTSLSIEGRSLRARRAAPGMVWFDFAELCEGPRSQNDYIELASLFHTVFITDIPVFDVFNENAARRFIMLIDELYDRGVKVVVSAATGPATLYRGERLQFEFERAASRLMEMQTQHYLSGGHHQ